MSRYIPTADERAAIDTLTLAGYHVMRRGSYANLQRRIDRAESSANWEKRVAERVLGWAIECLAEERRLERRLNDVCSAAATLGVSIADINTALSGNGDTPAL